MMMMLWALLCWFLLTVSYGHAQTPVPKPKTIFLRLINGPNYFSGTVQVRSSETEEWGTVCDDFWDNTAATVVCRMLGHKFGKAQKRAEFGEGTGTIFMDDVQCDGSESSLVDCKFKGWGVSNCKHYEDAGVICTNATVSLVSHDGGLTSSYGAVYVRTASGLVPVCDTDWGQADAAVACRSLGFMSGKHLCCSKLSPYKRYVSIGIDEMALTSLGCRGNETSIDKCKHNTTGECEAGRLASVICYNTTLDKVDRTIKVQWADGNVTNGGTVKIFREGLWGQLCNYTWNDAAANVTCKMMGYKYGVSHGSESTTLKGLAFWVTDVNCTGTETSLDQCSIKWGKSVAKSYFRGTNRVLCFNDIQEKPTLKLSNGTFGLVQVTFKGQTGTICTDKWSDYDARVVCKQLGFVGGAAVKSQIYGKGTGPVFLNNLLCNSKDKTVWGCKGDNWGQVDKKCLNHNSDASAICHKGTVKLTRGDHSHGIVNINIGGIWAEVCGKDTTQNEIKVMCRELGFQNGYAMPKAAYGPSYFKTYVGPYNCYGNETSITQCRRKSTTCYRRSSSDYASIGCYNGTLSNKTSVLLQDGTSIYVKISGHVVIRQKGVSGLICGTKWSEKEANVVCKELGFMGGNVYRFPSVSGGPYVRVGVNCVGNESSILDCPHTDASCYYSVAAGVLCYKLQKPELKLVGGTKKSGVVNIVHDGESGAVCRSYGSTIASVACIQLGFIDGVISREQNVTGSNPFMRDVTCYGHKSTLFQCKNSGWRTEESKPCTFLEVNCYGSVRLQRGSTNSNMTSGLVTVYDGSRWKGVCGQGFGEFEAKLACRELDYPYFKLVPGSVFRGGFFTYYYIYSCNGTETSLLQCRNRTAFFSCSRITGKAGLVCSKTPFTDDITVILKEVFPSEVIVNIYGLDASFCRSSWTDLEASVLCREKGFRNGIAFGANTLNDFSTSLWLGVNCTGHETSLSRCKIDTSLQLKCSSSYEPGVFCYGSSTGFQLSLENGNEQTPSSGRVVATFNGKKGVVCDSYFSDNDARVVCRQLGFSDGKSKSTFGKGTGNAWIKSPRCYGKETTLWSCPNSGFNSTSSICTSHANDAGVMCSGLVRLSQSETHGAIQVRDPSTDKYSLVCSDEFDDMDATVVCREVGYRFGISLCCSAFGYQRYQIGITDVKCTGLEPSLKSCPHKTTITNCPSRQYASVVCSNLGPSTGYQVKLSNGSYGNVAVNYMGIWGYICPDNFTDHDASVVCKEMGYLGGSAFINFKYTDNRLRWLNTMRCTGSEQWLSRCAGATFGTDAKCTVSGDAAVVCYRNKTEEVQYRVNITNGLTGVVQVFMGGVWGSVCNDFYFSNYDADVLCRMTGLYTGGEEATGSFADGSTAMLSQMRCPKNAKAISSCPLVLRGSCRAYRTTVAAVTCFTKARLYGSSSNYGQAQIYVNDQWLTVCDTNFDNNAAKVMCKSMGYSDGKAQCCSAVGSMKSQANITATIKTCTGSESDLFACQYTPSNRCSSGHYATVYCSQSTIQNYGLNKLMLAKKTSYVGAVLVNRTGFWGPVCDKGWTDTHAKLACVQMGWVGGVATFSTFSDAPMVVGNIKCTGSEISLNQCQINDFSTTTGCSYNTKGTRRVAGVLCYNRGVTVSLTGGDGNTYGFVDLEYDRVKAKVCSTFFYTTEAGVLCRQLGFESGRTSYILTAGRSSYEKVWMNNVKCQGNETSIFQCQHKWYTSYRSYCRRAQVQCYNSVYLSGGNMSYGVIHYKPYGVWGTICAAGWTQDNTQVACRELGYSYGKHLCCGAIYDKSNAIAVEVKCKGSEAHLANCTFKHLSNEDCHIDKAAVACFNAAPGTDFSWALDGGNNYTGGIVITYMGMEGRVCPDSWDYLDARVACRELGYANGTIYLHYHNTQRNSKGPLWTSNINCTGNEKRLNDCKMDPLGEVTTCSSQHTAGLLCFNKEDVYYRLTGKKDNIGRVEISVDGVWGTVCDRDFDFRTANVLCRSLGYMEGEVEPIRSAVNQSNTPPTPVYTGAFRCTGQESTLTDCPHDGWHLSKSFYCSNHYSDAAISCYGKLKLGLRYDVDLTQGPVRYYYDNTWYPVCDSGFTDTSAKRVCQDLNYADGKAICCSAYGNLDSHHEYRPKPVFKTNISMVCAGGEDSIEKCVKVGVCQSKYYASVVCFNNTAVINEDYTFTFGKKPTGMVVATHYGISGRVCNNLWDDFDAKVFCKNNHFTDGIAYHYDPGDDLPSFKEPFWLSSVNCTGKETGLAKCPFNDRMSLGNCSYSDVSSALCFNGDHDIKYNMSGGANYGRVDIRVGGVWGTVCDEYWDDREAGVFCRQKGFDDGYALDKATYGQGSGPVWLSHLMCTGKETTLHTCPHKGFHDEIVDDSSFFPRVCESHADDASVYCVKSLRLNLGMNASQGAVQIYQDHKWTTVCADGFNAHAAKVVCTQLGFSEGIDIGNSNFGPMKDPTGISSLTCTGTETDVTACRITKSTTCPSKAYAGVICSKQPFVASGFNMRMIPEDPAKPFYGRLEVENDGVKGSVCMKGFGTSEATVVCKHIGYAGGVPMDTEFDISGFLNGGKLKRDNEPPIIMSNVHCSGTEKTLKSCKWSSKASTKDCHYEAKRAGVLCYNDTGVKYQVGSGSGTGAVEIRVNGRWGPVCDLLRRPENAVVACKSAGYSSGMFVPSTPYLAPYRESSKMMFYYIYCIGQETMLTECINDGYDRIYSTKNYNTRCQTGYLMTVQCFNKPIAITEVRIVDGQTANEGRLEVFLQGPDKWGTVCDDLWDNTDASVVCQQLGYKQGGKAVKLAAFFPGSGPIWLDDVNCFGNESSINQCPHAGFGESNCQHNEDAGVICQDKQEPITTTTVKLVTTPRPAPKTTPTQRPVITTPKPATSETMTAVPGESGRSSGSVDESVLIPATIIPIVVILLVLACVLILVRRRNLGMDDTSSLVSGGSSSFSGASGSVMMNKDSVAYSPEVRDNEDNNAFTNPMYDNAIGDIKLDLEAMEVNPKVEADEQV
ncbi:deleted in malignant brain tumors 1 protein-like [Gigantopelta aegis]|uniref:deleted in malignant brain tumors 1 protein-like n=1 Tax=Gigantopelta aegis TaxID=1735272 RepID=UPI001B8879D8|nr:deleted in malignant brain tumors 1 protein-like [Gigantopelta aegis]